MENEKQNEIGEEKVKLNSEKESNWLKEELEDIEKNGFDGEKLPSLKIEEGKIVTFTVDYDPALPFRKWVDEKTGTVKKIMPVKYKEEDYVFWINVKNPLYTKILKKLNEGQKTFKVTRTGQMQNTKYTILEE